MKTFIRICRSLKQIQLFDYVEANLQLDNHLKYTELLKMVTVQTNEELNYIN